MAGAPLEASEVEPAVAVTWAEGVARAAIWVPDTAAAISESSPPHPYKEEHANKAR